MFPPTRPRLIALTTAFVLLVAVGAPYALVLAAESPSRSPACQAQRLQRSLVDLANASGRPAPEIDAVAQGHALDLHDGRVLVVIEHEGGNQTRLIQRLRALGLRIDSVAEGRLSALAPPSSLLAASELPEVIYVRRPLPVTAAGITSEGVGVMGALPWHAAGQRGEGMIAAVIDLGFEGIDVLQASGDLPTGDRLQVRNMKAAPVDERGQHGGAVAEVLYDVAPGLDKLFLYALDDDPDLSAIVSDMIAQGVQVAAMSLGWANASPYDGSGFLADQVNRARNEGDIFFAVSAGNHAHQHYEGTFTPLDESSYHAFAPGSDANRLGVFLAGSELTVGLSWSEWPTATSNYDLIIAQAGLQEWTELYTFQDDGPTPTEGGTWVVPATGVYGCKIIKVSGHDRHLELYQLGSDLLGTGLEYPVAESSLLSPADADGAVAVGAHSYASTGAIEYFSSQGPRNAPGGEAWDGVCPNPSCKPDLVGPDGNRTASYGAIPFYGTSSATPHVAGAAALIRGAMPWLSAQETFEFLVQRAVDQGAVGDDNTWGLGRVQMGPPPGSETPTATPLPPPTATVTPTTTAAPTATSLTPTVSPTAPASVLTLPVLLKGRDLTQPRPTPTPTVEQVATLRLAPVLYLAQPGDEVTIQIQASSPGQPVDAAEIIIAFDPAALTLVDAQGEPAEAIRPKPSLDLVLRNRVDNERGRIVYTAERSDPTPLHGAFAIAEFTMRVDATSGEHTILFTESSDLLYGLRSVLAGTEGARIIIQP
jgi:subtilisin family serine protease